MRELWFPAALVVHVPWSLLFSRSPFSALFTVALEISMSLARMSFDSKTGIACERVHALANERNEPLSAHAVERPPDFYERGNDIRPVFVGIASPLLFGKLHFCGLYHAVVVDMLPLFYAGIQFCCCVFPVEARELCILIKNSFLPLSCLHGGTALQFPLLPNSVPS